MIPISLTYTFPCYLSDSTNHDNTVIYEFQILILLSNPFGLPRRYKYSVSLINFKC